MKLLFLACVACALAPWATAVAQSTRPLPPAPAEPAAQQPAPTRMAKAVALARIIQPRDLVMTSAVTIGEKAFRQAFAAGANADALSARYPDLIDGAWSVVKPLMTQHLDAKLPGLVDKLALFYAERMTDAELDHLARFYSAPTGHKIVRHMHLGFDAAPMVNELIAETGSDAPANISQSAVKAGTQSALKGLPALMNAGDLAALQVFMRQVPIAKLQSIGAESQKMMVAWINEADPAFDAQLEAAVTDYMRRFAPAKEGLSKRSRAN